MKKLMILMLSLILCFVLIACADNSQTQSEDDDEEKSDKNDDEKGDSNNGDDDASEVPYVGSWVHENTDDEPYFFTFTLEEDGSGTMGRTGKTHLTWEENDDDTISITLEYADGSTENGQAKLLDDGTLRFDHRFVMTDADGNQYNIEYLIMEKA